MKKLIIALSFFLYVTSVYAQSYEIRFQSGNSNVTLDSVKVESISKNVTKYLKSSDILVLDYSTGLEEPYFDNGSIVLSPNPNSGKVVASFTSNEASPIQVVISTSQGSIIFEESIFIESGNHKINIEGLPSGLNMLSISGNEFYNSAKMPTFSNTKHSSSIKISHTEFGYGNKNENTLKTTSEYITLPYSIGDALRYTGIGENQEIIINDTPDASKIVVFQFVDNNPIVSLPTVIIDPINQFTTNSALVVANVIADGGATVTARGVCWSTSQNPTIYDNITTNGTGIGSFTSSLTDLTENTTYYVRAYATNSEGTAYSNNMGFTTLEEQQIINLPTIVTQAVSSITEISAICGGTITSDGGATITVRGVCWSTSQNPTISDNKTTNGAGIGSFTSSLADLTENTTYYVRAYATNSEGTAYGEQVGFTTTLNVNNPDTSGVFTDTRDGNEYKWVKIGEQIWMAENLRYLPTVVGQVQGSATSSYYYVYGYDGTDVNAAKLTTNYITYGVLYNWIAAMSSSESSTTNPSGVQGVCPTGWHLPSDDEWTELTDYLGGVSVAGGKLKQTGTTYWPSPNTGATNETGFSALPGGFRHGNRRFYSVLSEGSWWSSTANRGNVFRRSMNFNSASVGRYDYGIENGFSVRCVKD